MNQYSIDAIASMAERTIKRLWILIIILVLLLFGTNAAWIYYESQFVDEEVTQTVEQDTENGDNSFNYVGGDYYGTANSNNDSQETNP